MRDNKRGRPNGRTQTSSQGTYLRIRRWLGMARYFFDIRNGGSLELDVEGIELESSDAAYREALAAARDTIAEYIRFDMPIEGMTFVIRDDEDKVVGEVPFMSVIR